MAKAKLLLVEDDADILEVLRLTFRREGYETFEAEDGETAIQLARRHVPDLVVLDVMLPGKDGTDVCREIRADSSLQNILILMVTARGEESDVVLGLGVGADDYVVKPARPRELVARVKALLRRSRLKDEVLTDQLISYNGVVVDPVRFEVRTEQNDGEELRVELTPTEFRILQCLINYPGRVYRRSELLDAAVGTGVFVDERNVDTHVKSVRKKLGDKGDLIGTVRGIGYRFAD